jgi:DUF1365 family protein
MIHKDFKSMERLRKDVKIWSERVWDWLSFVMKEHARELWCDPTRITTDLN